jgi:uncharacterized membrane protein required for colicin V production
LFLDIFIAVVFLAAVVIGFQRGVIAPFLAEVGFFGTLIVILRNRNGWASAIERLTHTNTPVLPVVGAVMVAIILGYVGGFIGARIHRMPVVRGLDGFLGVFLHTLLAVVFLYLVVASLVVAHNAFVPLESAVKLTLAQVDQLQTELDKNPITGALGDSHSIKDLRTEAKAPAGATLSSAPQLKAAELFYDDFLDPQLRSSRLAVWVLRVGSHIPFAGRIGPADLPRGPAPTPSPTPSVNPSPTK